MKRRTVPAFAAFVVILFCAVVAFGQVTTTTRTPSRTPSYSPTPTRTNTPTRTPTNTPTPTPTSNRTAALSLTKAASPNPARVGEDLTYTLTVHNSGPNIALGLFLQDSLPADVVYVSSSFLPGGSCIYSGATTVSCFLNVPALVSGDSVQAVIVVRPTSAGSVTNSAEVHSNGFDPDLSDNTATVTTEVRNPAIPLFLRGNGNPVVLSLDGAAPTAAAAKYRDSAALVSGLRNPWVEIGTWPAPPALVTGTVIGFDDLRAWIGLRNSDDQGTQFDLRAEAWKNGLELVAAGETSCIKGLVREPANARETAVRLDIYTPVVFDGTTDSLSLKVLARIGTGCSGPGHGGATGIRLYYDGVRRPSGFAWAPAPSP